MESSRKGCICFQSTCLFRLQNDRREESSYSVFLLGQQFVLREVSERPSDHILQDCISSNLSCLRWYLLETVAPSPCRQCTPGNTPMLCRHSIVELVTKHSSLGKQSLASRILKQMLLVSPELQKQIMRHRVKLGSFQEL